MYVYEVERHADATSVTNVSGRRCTYGKINVIVCLRICMCMRMYECETCGRRCVDFSVEKEGGEHPTHARIHTHTHTHTHTQCAALGGDPWRILSAATAQKCLARLMPAQRFGWGEWDAEEFSCWFLFRSNVCLNATDAPQFMTCCAAACGSLWLFFIFFFILRRAPRALVCA
jgi:hypothetical protein